jgi:hypothetical protein
VTHLGHSSGDNPWTHENSFEPCPTPTVEALANETLCPSDWDLDARGLPGFAGMQSSGRDYEHVEFERYFSQYFFTGWGEPRPGDLLFTSGRYIVDCGHNEINWKTEIHPPSVLAFMRNETWYGRPSTQANIWVTGFFTGEAVEFDIIPPPRPSPTATLGYIKPIGSIIDVTVTASTPELDRVRVRITSPTIRHVQVTSLGEMKWQAGRGYEGRWHVFWNP